MLITYSSYRSKPQKSKAKFPFSRTEATATSWLQEQIFFGVGPRYLGWRFPVYDVLPDGSEVLSEKAGPRCWWTPPTEERYKWRPAPGTSAWRLSGCGRWRSNYVPFVTTELDRHSGNIQAAEHIEAGDGDGRLLKSQFSFVSGVSLNWCAEVNPKNGSVKFFGWANSPIFIDTAREIGQEIHEALESMVSGIWPGGLPIQPWSGASADEVGQDDHYRHGRSSTLHQKVQGR